MLLPLVIDPAGLHRRRVWEAWKSEGRTGRWGALLGVGARIRAADLGNIEPYRTPKPFVRKVFPTGERGIGRVQIEDPEDDDYVPPVEAPPKRRKVLAP